MFRKEKKKEKKKERKKDGGGFDSQKVKNECFPTLKNKHTFLTLMDILCPIIQATKEQMDIILQETDGGKGGST